MVEAEEGEFASADEAEAAPPRTAEPGTAEATWADYAHASTYRGRLRSCIRLIKSEVRLMTQSRAKLRSFY